MIKFRLTETSNIILALIGIAFSFGFFMDQSTVYPLFIFCFMSILFFLYRTKFQAINYLAIGINFLVYLFTFGFYNNVFFGLYISSPIMMGLAGFTSVLFVINAVLNYLLMTGKLKYEPSKK